MKSSPATRIRPSAERLLISPTSFRIQSSTVSVSSACHIIAQDGVAQLVDRVGVSEAEAAAGPEGDHAGDRQADSGDRSDDVSSSHACSRAGLQNPDG